jgi:hypothetical protein
MRQLIPFALAAAAFGTGCNFTPPDDGRPRPEGKERERPLAFGAVSRVEGTSFFTVPIQEAARGGGSYSSAGDVERNRIIVDGGNGANRMLLPDNKREIVRWVGGNGPDEAFGQPYRPAERQRPPATIFAAVVTSLEGPADQRRYDLLLGRFETGQSIWAARGLDGVGDLWLDEDGRLGVVISAQGKMLYRLYDPASLQPLVESELKLNR